MSPLIGICLWLATAPAQTPPVFVPTTAFTLAWVHSIEKVRWEEDYRVEPPAVSGQPPVLRAGQARIKGSGAGMEPPDGALLERGWYTYPGTPVPSEGLRLTRSVYTADYDLCIEGRCAPMSHWLPSDGGLTRLQACQPKPAPALR